MIVTMTDIELEVLVERAVVSALSRARPSRIALSPREAAEVLGVSRTYFDDSILPRLKVRKVGRRILVPIDEIDRFLRS